MIRPPEAFARNTLAREGERATAWLAELPAIVNGLLGRWECAPDGDVTHGGVGVIVPVLRKAGEHAVLKVSFPHPGNRHEPDALAAWNGRGAVRLYERDDEQFAMLLERAHPLTLAQAGTGDEVARVAGQVSRRLAIPAPPDLPRLQDQASQWEEQLRQDTAEFPHALPPYIVSAARASIHDLAHNQPGTLVHGDLNTRNILKAEREPWLAVDPKGWAGDPASDCGTLIKSRSVALVEVGDLRTAVLRTLDIFTEAAGLDRERARRWAQLSAVQAAFSGRRHGFRRARRGAELNRLITLVDALAVILAPD